MLFQYYLQPCRHDGRLEEQDADARAAAPSRPDWSALEPQLLSLTQEGDFLLYCFGTSFLHFKPGKSKADLHQVDQCPVQSQEQPETGHLS